MPNLALRHCQGCKSSLRIASLELMEAEGSGHSLMDKVRLGKSDPVIFMKNLSVCLPEFVTR